MAASVRVRPYGADAVLLEVADSATAVDLAAWLRAQDAASEVVPGAVTVLLDGVADPDALPDRLEEWRPGAREDASHEVTIPVTYDGPDLDAVAEAWSIAPEQVADRHAGIGFVAAFCGFAPGFAYLTGLPRALAVPRLETPRTRVPAGAVGIADTWCGVYPTASPGGWRLIGRTEAVLWDADRQPPALIVPGTRVRFTAA